MIISATNPAMIASIIAGGPILVEASDTSSIVGAAGGDRRSRSAGRRSGSRSLIT